ncbi:AAA family ATPase [Streptomyces sp. NPDC094049]|uniref:AAA family ATPase n=1 Tax=Streptomyces sp. NPDC094049 TaxID=3154987 RepID=UPI0033244BB0
MKRYGHGLVVGRFHPPHAGHHHLVATARERCERLTVLVRASAADSLTLDERVAWMRETHPDALVVGAPADDADTPAARTAALRAAVPERIDAVFTSAAHPEEPGRRLGAATVRVDSGHLGLPASEAVRADPAGCWDHLAPPVRAALTRRVVVLGAESTGATTMTLALTGHYRRRGGVWARTRYVAGHEDDAPGARRHDRPPRSVDFPVLAQCRADREEEAARDGAPVLFCDTDAFATTIWHERHTGTSSPAVGEIAARGRQHLWLLTDHRGVPYEPTGDTARQDGDRLRPWMTARFLTQLTRTGRRTAVLTGPHEERLAAAVAAVDALLAEGWGLTEPPEEPR